MIVYSIYLHKHHLIHYPHYKLTLILSQLDKKNPINNNNNNNNNKTKQIHTCACLSHQNMVALNPNALEKLKKRSSSLSLSHGSLISMMRI